jgi:hypothetical protein
VRQTPIPKKNARYEKFPYHCKKNKRDVCFKREVVVRKEAKKMKIMDQAKEKAATGYILLWLLGIPIPILLLIFLLRGCT